MPIGDLPRERRREVRPSQGERETLRDRVWAFYERDWNDRSDERTYLLDLAAKMRSAGGRDLPWETASDQKIPDILSDVLHTQDTLHNAVMSSRPVVRATPMSGESVDRADKLSALQDTQLFEEQDGEHIIGELASGFTEDPAVYWFVAWTRDKRAVTERRIFDPIPENDTPTAHFGNILSEAFPKHQRFEIDGDERTAWDFRVVLEDESERDVSFYTLDDGRVEMIVRGRQAYYEGPRITIPDYSNVFYPIRAANLQRPTPSNPGGASHVILRDFPSLEEIEEDFRNGFYDLLTEDDMETIRNTRGTFTRDEMEVQKDEFRRQRQTGPVRDESLGLESLLCFDCYDLDGDGEAEDVVCWVIAAGGKAIAVARVRPLLEQYPDEMGRRPIGHTSYLPEKGRVAGMSLPEILEGVHDLVKNSIDAAFDNGELANSPFFFYDPGSEIQEVDFALAPGEGYPVRRPQENVLFPTLTHRDQTFFFNMVTLGGQMRERLSTISDLQQGRIPAGRSSALRTVSGIQTLLAQGEARPERILRRFFMGLVGIFRAVHEANKAFLRPGKRFRMLDIGPGEDPYDTIRSIEMLRGEYRWSFRATVLSASRGGQSLALGQFADLALNPLAMATRIIDPGGIFRLVSDLGESLGVEPKRYLSAPQPDAAQPRILASEAMQQILGGATPAGVPAEGALAHLQTLQQLVQGNRDVIDALSESQRQLLTAWLARVGELARQEVALQERVAAAGQRGNGAAGAAEIGGGQPAQERPLGEGETRDEELPSARGGPATV